MMQQFSPLFDGKTTKYLNWCCLFKSLSARHVIALVLACSIFQSANAQWPCYDASSPGPVVIVGSKNMFYSVVGCGQGSVNMPSTGSFDFYLYGGVTYNFTLSSGGWGSGYGMTFYNTSSSVLAYTYNATTASYTYTPTSDGQVFIATTNGTACYPPWTSNSAVLTYQIATPTIPAIAEGASEVCQGTVNTYTASNITVGSFYQFIYGIGSTGTTLFAGSNPYSWTATNPGSTFYIEAQSNNGGCISTSSYVTTLIDYPSSDGSFGSNLYSCGSGSTYTLSGVLTAQTISGYTGTIQGWGYGSSSTCSSNTTGYPSGVGSATAPWTTIPGDAPYLLVSVKNGTCSPSTSCNYITPNTMTAPSTASVSPSNECQGYAGNITLSYTGGGSTYLPATLKWYSGSCGGTLVGTGQNLTISAPSSTTNYYCAWVDPCGDLTSCASTTFTVTPTPTVSASSYAICQGSAVTLSPSTGGNWTESNSSLFTLSGNTATSSATGTGSGTFTYTMSASPYCTATTSAVTVSANPVVSITGPTTICGSGQTTTTLSPTSGGTWASNNTSAATVSGYTVSGTTAGGTATFTFTNSASPNCTATTGSVTVIALPTVYGVTGGGTYCYGSSSVVGLNGSQTGVTYQLVLNGTTNVGSPVSGTGSAISFGGQTTVGTYTVVATTTTNSCTATMSGSAVVNVLSPNVTNTAPTNVGTNAAQMNGTD